MGGKAQAAGSDVESDAFAYLAAHVLARESLAWFGSDPDDTPLAIRTQTGGAGDDFAVELRSGRTIEVQSKGGASGNDDFKSAAVRLFRGLHDDPDLRGVILVDTNSTTTIRREFREDALRLAGGIEGETRDVMTAVIERLGGGGTKFDHATMSRFRLIVLDLEPGTEGSRSGQELLGRVLEEPGQRAAAWDRLGREGLRVARRAGRQDRDALAALLNLRPRPVPPDDDARERYLDWAIETNAAFVLAPLPDLRIDSFEAWDELTPPLDPTLFAGSDTEVIRAYHDWEERRDKISVTDHWDACKLLESGKSAVIVGGGGAGKSTLTRRLVREACEGGMLALRVSLRHIALLTDGAKTMDDAIVAVAFDGSGIDDAAARRLLAGMDVLIADGLDETEPRRADVAQRLVAWMNGHPNVAVIVTTRPVGHAAALLPGLPLHELTALHAGGTLRLARQIFVATLKDEETADSTLEAFDTELETNRAAAVAARNPLLLTCMVALALEGRPLPQGRGALIEEVIDLLRRTTPHDRTVTVERVDRDVANRVLELAAWLLAETPALTRDRLIDSVTARLDDLSKREAHRAADQALTFWEEHRVLERLRSGTREYLTFVHLHLGEYAAARVVAAMSDQEVAAWVTRVHRLPQWRQVLRFASEAGDAERIARILLDLDEPSLAAECLEERAEPDRELITRTVDALTTRLGSADEMAAADVLVRLAVHAPERVSHACLPLLDAPGPVTRLAAEAGVFAGDPVLIPEGMPRKWLEEYLPIQLVLRGTPPERISPLPYEADELQHLTALLAVDALFKTASRDEAMQVAGDFVPRATTTILFRIESVLRRHDATELLADVARRTARLTSSIWDFGGDKRREALLAILDAIAASVGTPPAEEAVRRTLPLLSRVLSAIEYQHDDFEWVHERTDQESVELIIDRTLRGIRIEREALRRELASAYRIVHSLTARGIYPHIRIVAVHVDWRAAAAEVIEPEQLRRALVHTAPGVVRIATHLLAAGATGSEARAVIAGALAENRKFTAFYLTQVAPGVLRLDAAVAILRDALQQPDATRRLRGIFEALAFVDALRAGFAAEIVKALVHPNSWVAEAAADALEHLKHQCTDAYVAALHDAISFWQTHPAWCPRCDREVAERFCPKCRGIGLPRPDAALHRELARCAAADTA